MAKLLYSATTADGSPTEGTVNAPSLVAAREQLERRGLREVTLREDERVAHRAPPQVTDELAPEFARFKQALIQAPTLKAVLADQARSSRLWLLADAALVVGGIAQGAATWIAAGLLAAAAPFALTAWNFRHADRYQRLLRQYAVGNWDAVRVLAKELRQASAGKPELEFDLDLRLAGIYARDHALDEALARLEPWRERVAMQPGAFETRLAAVHLMAGDTAGHVQLLARAQELKPGDPARQAEHALAQARFGSIELAERLLEALGSPDLAVPHQASVLWARGLVQLRRGEAAAQATLARAVALWLTCRQQPALWTSLALCACDQAVALHEAGTHDAARARVADVWPVLQVHATVPLLRMLEADDLLPVRSATTF